MAKKRLSVSLRRKHAMTVTRVSIGPKKKLVYVILADKPLKYPWGKSKIAYIGTTKKGMSRFAQSAAAKADEVLSLHGVKEMEVRVVTCAARQAVKTWVKLERAMLLVFRQEFGSVPLCNTVGKNIRETDEFSYFTRRRIKTIIDSLSE